VQFLIWTELHKLAVRRLDQRQVALYAAKLYSLLSQMLGPHSIPTVVSSYTYAASISRLGMGNTTARDLLSAGLESSSAAFGPDGIIACRFSGRLGKEMALLGDADGIPRMFRALSILETHLEKESSSSEFEELANDIWDILLSQAKLEDARSLLLRVSESCESKLGPYHIGTCKYLVDLGYLHLSMGNATQAEEVLLDVLARLEGTVGSQHAETLRAMSNLAAVYRIQERQEDSIRIRRRVLEVREITLGPKAWRTLLCMSDLGVSLREFGSHEEAKIVLIEAKRRLEELPDPFADVVHYVATALRGLEDEAEGDAIRRAEQRLETINISDDVVLSRENADFISHLIGLYLEKGRLDDAYQLAKQAGKATRFYNGEDGKRWDFSEELCDVLERMPGREQELVETCREALDKLDLESDKSKDIIVRREIAVGKALLRAGQEEEGVRVLVRGIEHAKHLDEQSRAWYREGTAHLFRHYTRSMLAGESVDSSSQPSEFWDRIIKLMGPERGTDVF
jgi:tetratricopeptide (TPR) repeat protein